MILECYLSFRVCRKRWIVFHIAIGNLLFECRGIDAILKGDLVIEPKGNLSILLFDLAFVPFAERIGLGIAADTFHGIETTGPMRGVYLMPWFGIGIVKELHL